MKNQCLLLFCLVFGVSIFAEEAVTHQNKKLLSMFRFYFLPFSIEFNQTKGSDEILPKLLSKNGAAPKLLSPEEMQQVEQTWAGIRKDWKTRSLLLTTPVGKGEVIRISDHLYSYKIPVSQTLFSSMPITEQIQLKNALANKNQQVKEKVLQLEVLKYLVGRSKAPAQGTHLFLFSPSWCESSKEYRALFEAYLKTFRNKDFTLHSITIDDENEQIFTSHFFHEIFPEDDASKKEMIVPRFLALVRDGKESLVLQEEEALDFVFQQYFIGSRGFLDTKLPFNQGKSSNVVNPRALSSLPE